jgi:hypothetical protein
MESLGEDTEGLAFETLTMINQPAQVLDGYNPGPSPVVPGSTFQDDSMVGTSDEINDAKRRRIARVRALSTQTNK